MIYRYKKRFVIITMSLVGTVLTVVFLALAVFISSNKYRSIENTMSQVAKPWNSFGLEESKRINFAVPTKPDFEIEDSDEQVNSSVMGEYVYATYQYNIYSKEINEIISSDFILKDRLNSVLEKVALQKDNFGIIKDEDIIYFKNEISDNNSLNIVITSQTFFRGDIFIVISALVVAYILLMIGFIIISRKLSSLAAKPMEDAMEMEKQFITDVSHDLKTPITVILANNSILKSNLNSTVSEQIQWVDSTDTAARNMLEMINEMLSFSTLEADRQNIELKRIDASSIAEKCVLQFESIAYDRKIEFITNIDDAIFINSTKDFTERIFNSIIENAFKYEVNGGKVTVSFKLEKRKAVFKVQNFGSSISEKDLPHIFEKFYRADKTRNELKGHGLGLPMIMQITKIINAKISAKSSSDKGTTFTVVFELDKSTEE